VRQPGAEKMNKAEWKIEIVMQMTECDRDTAIAYLVAEEWSMKDAVLSFKGDHANNDQPSHGKPA